MIASIGSSDEKLLGTIMLSSANSSEATSLLLFNGDTMGGSCKRIAFTPACSSLSTSCLLVTIVAIERRANHRKAPIVQAHLGSLKTPVWASIIKRDRISLLTPQASAIRGRGGAITIVVFGRF